jgi:hypothetical protein
VESLSQDKRAIVRKRTQQLVYLELGRDNGGVMLNLSEDGCGFQAITPVKPGQTRFAFQISGGRRISGEADVVWVDDVGIMGGLRFLNLPLEARKQIRRWLEETKAPEEHGAFEPVAEAPMASARSSREEREEVVTESTEPPWMRGYQQSPPNEPPSRTMEVEIPPASTAWSTLRASSASVGHDPRYSSIPPLRDEGPYVASRPRSVALWRGIAVIAVVTAIFALVVAYQHDVGNSLIWLGETLSGRTKAFSSPPESKPASNPASDTSADTSSASAAPDSDAASSKATEHGAEPAASTAKKADETSASVTSMSQSSRPDSGSAGSDRTESMLERQVPRDKPVEEWSSSDSVSSLWDAVEGGSISAERALAERFVHGEGVNRNCDQAKVLLKAAADRGSREARLRLYELETSTCR